MTPLRLLGEGQNGELPLEPKTLTPFRGAFRSLTLWNPGLAQGLGCCP